MNIRRLKRYLLYSFQYWMTEKPRGLDFTMRDTTLLKKTGGVFHGYAKTDDHHVKDVFCHLDYKRSHKLLDVGCGKGVVLREACQFPFEVIAGFDIVPELVKTAENNFKILGLQNRINVSVSDAVEYEGYGDYDTFFFSNPVNADLTDKIMKEILRQKKDEINTICFYHMTPEYLSVFMDTGRCRLRDKLYDPIKGYETYILEIW